MPNSNYIPRFRTYRYRFEKDAFGRHVGMRDRAGDLVADLGHWAGSSAAEVARVSSRLVCAIGAVSLMPDRRPNRRQREVMAMLGSLSDERTVHHPNSKGDDVIVYDYPYDHPTGGGRQLDAVYHDGRHEWYGLGNDGTIQSIRYHEGPRGGNISQTNRLSDVDRVAQIVEEFGLTGGNDRVA